MLTTCLLPVSTSMHCAGGCLLLGGCLPLVPGGCLLLGGVCSWGGAACLWSGGIPACNWAKEKLYIYRPQTKFAKAIFLHLSVSHSVHKGVGGGVPNCMLGYLQLECIPVGCVPPTYWPYPPWCRPPWMQYSPGCRPPLLKVKIRKTVTGSEKSDKWRKRNSAYFTTIGYSKNKLTLVRFYWPLVRIPDI